MEKPLKLTIEALLFATDRPLSANDIHGILDEKALPEIKQALDELKGEYDRLERSFVLKEVAEGYQFRSLPDYAPFILRMYKSSPTRLSRAAIETLSIIAYKQPILRQEIERLRGVDVGGILRTLMEKGLIRIVGRKSLPGKPLIYGTTRRFLEVFDLKDLESLPKLKEIKALGTDEQETEPSPETETSTEASGPEKSPQGVQDPGEARPSSADETEQGPLAGRTDLETEGG